MVGPGTAAICDSSKGHSYVSPMQCQTDKIGSNPLPSIITRAQTGSDVWFMRSH